MAVPHAKDRHQVGDGEALARISRANVFVWRLKFVKAGKRVINWDRVFLLVERRQMTLAEIADVCGWPPHRSLANFTKLLEQQFQQRYGRPLPRRYLRSIAPGGPVYRAKNCLSP